MNAIVFTSEGTTYGPNPQVEVENCQILGFIEAPSPHAAIASLFADHPWISQAGFTLANAKAIALQR